jgi:hypothetical protein
MFGFMVRSSVPLLPAVQGIMQRLNYSAIDSFLTAEFPLYAYSFSPPTLPISGMVIRCRIAPALSFPETQLNRAIFKVYSG